MTPYYEKDGITIYNADSREVVNNIGNVDLLLTDPPYGIDGGRGGNRQRGKGKYASCLWDDNAEYIYNVVLPIINNCLEISTRGIITPGIFKMHLYPAPTDIGCFYTPASVSYGPWGHVTFNPILYYGKDPRSGKGPWPTGKQITEGPSTKKHPCAKPLNAWQWLLAKGSLDSDDLVLDPFMGSGTTLRVAKNLGRKAIGIEIEEMYCEIAVERLSQEVLF